MTTMTVTKSTPQHIMASVLTRDPPYVGKDTTLRVLKIVDMDRAFTQSYDPIVLNRYDFSNPDYATQISDAVHSSVRVGDVDFVARCECGRLHGNYYFGSTCPKCHTEVRYDTFAADGHLQHKAWIELPDTIPGWLNPAVAGVLMRWLRYKSSGTKYVNKTTGDIANKNDVAKGNYIEDILDVTTPIPEELRCVIDGKGFKYFYNNFDRIMNFFLYDDRAPRCARKQNNDVMAYFLKANRNRIFCRYIPILSSALHPIIMAEGQSENRNQYVEKHAQFVNTAAAALSYYAHSGWRKKLANGDEIATFKAYQCMLAYEYEISQNHLSKKKSIPRMHIFGSRLHFTFRGVITQIIGMHSMDELHLPWPIAVNLLRVHIWSRLVRQGYSSGEAMAIQQSAIQCYDERIAKMMDEFIDECPFKGLPVWFDRNPSIQPGSIQLMFVTKIKKDPYDKSIGFSAMACPLPNADYDGDEMNGLLIIEMDAVKDFMAMHPANLYLSPNAPEVTSMIKIPVNMLISANHFLGV